MFNGFGFCNYMYLAGPIEAEATATDPWAESFRCSPYDGEVERNATGRAEDFPTFLGVSIWLDGSGTKPICLEEKKIVC